MNRQNKTGNITEKCVKDKIIELGLDAYKPILTQELQMLGSILMKG